MSPVAQRLAEALRQVAGKHLLVVTGAGVSFASGIPTFRGSDPDAVWRHDDVELATREYFHRDPVGQWQWYLGRFDRILDTRPNPAHYALVGLETWHQEGAGDFLLVTQNIDTLHEQAGSRRLVKVHGSADRVRCSRFGCRHGAPSGSLPREVADFDAFRANPSLETLPRCPECHSPLRAHALFFDEYYHDHQDYQFDRVAEAAERADLVLFVGTSLAVGITDLILRSAFWRNVPVMVVDPSGRKLIYPFPHEILPARAEEILPQVCRELGVEIPPAQEPVRGKSSGGELPPG